MDERELRAPSSESTESAGEPAAPQTGASRADLAAAAVVVALTLAHVAYYFPRVVDDLFISLRYADNLAHGRGAVYNVGERVEGYSGPAWMFLQALGVAVGLEGVTWTKVLGVGSLLAMQGGLFLLTRRVFGVAGLLAWLPAVACAGNSYVVNWAVLGLETPFHLAAMVLCPVALHEHLARPSRRSAILAGAAVVALATARPESPMYVAIASAAPLAAARSRAEAVSIVRALLRVLLPAGGVLAALLLARYAYYGYLVPNTYFVKGAGVPFDAMRLAPLWAQGVGRFEAILLLFGSASLVVFGATRRVAAPALFVLACMYFTASVVTDWMPSLRHLLPVTVLAPVGFAVLADALRRREPTWVRAASLIPVAVVLLAALEIVRVDNRYSPEEERGRGWVMKKTDAKWKDTLLAYRRVEPPHVTRMDSYNMGQITQAWGVLESSQEPVEDSWFAGRDIGAVGYYTGVRVFDTAGLFTPVVAHSAAWTDLRVVTDTLVDAMMAKRPLGGEIYEGWERALGRRPSLLQGYKLRFGSMQAPFAWIAVDRPKPSHEQVVGRYEAFVARFPRLYHLHTLYGESIGAVAEKRLRAVRGH